MKHNTDMLQDFLDRHDFSLCTEKAFRSDWNKFVHWYEKANQESFDIHRITVRDVADFRDHLFNVRQQSISTVNRALVCLRRFLGHLVDRGELSSNPAAQVRELKKVPSVPQGLNTGQVRKVLREIELRMDHRAGAVVGMMLHTGLRVSDVVNLKLEYISITPRSGHVICRSGKGRKQRTVPLSREARRLLSAYLESRPDVTTESVFVGKRGPLGSEGIRAICNKYSTITGVDFTPHTLRHTFAKRFLQESGNDLSGLAQILGHENLNTTAIYTKQDAETLQGKVEQMVFD